MRRWVTGPARRVGAAAFRVTKPRRDNVSNAAPSNETSEYAAHAEFPAKVATPLRGKMGAGRYDLLRALYKELRDESRREYALQPPPPKDGFRCVHQPGSRVVEWYRQVSPSTSLYAWTDKPMMNSPLKHDSTYIVPGIELDVCIVRAPHVLHVSLSVWDSNMEVKTIRVYDDPKGELACYGGHEVSHVRDRIKYWGPYFFHLDEPVQNELLSTLADYGVDRAFLLYCMHWMHYVDHVEHVRWLRTVLEALAPAAADCAITSEAQLLSKEELEELDAPLPAKIELVSPVGVLANSKETMITFEM